MLHATKLYFLFLFHHLSCHFPESLAEIGTSATRDLESPLASYALSGVETNTLASVEGQSALQDPAKIIQKEIYLLLFINPEKQMSECLCS